MKRICAIAVLIIACAGLANAANRIELFSDAGATSCELEDHGIARVTVYAFLVGTEPAVAVRFKAPRPACWEGATWVADHVPYDYGSVGNSQEDWMVNFYNNVPLCLAPPVLIGSTEYDATGVSLSCCELLPAAPLTSSQNVFLYVDCNYNDQPLSAGHGVTINPNDSCHCVNPVAIESSTWGRVKALYRN